MSKEQKMAAPSVLECPICNDQYGNDHYTTPRVLSCGHTYCTKCLTQLVSAQRGKRCGVKCAFCNHLHELIRPDPILIPTNHAVIEIIKLGDVVPDAGPKCEYKGAGCTGTATWVCFDCTQGANTMFCANCIKAEHERGFVPVSRHRRSPMAQLNDSQNAFCSWHSGRPATMYSLKLRKFACVECNSRPDFAEQQALFVPIGDATRQLRSQAKRLVQYSQDVLARLNIMLENIASNNAELGPSVQQAKTQIQEKFAAITNIVQERQQTLMDRVELEFSQRKQRMEEQLVRIKKTFKDLNSAQSSLNSTLGKHDVDFLLNYQFAFNAMEKVLSEEDRSLQRIVSYRDIPFYIPQNIMSELQELGAVGGGAVPVEISCECSNKNCNLMKLRWEIPHGASEVQRYEIEYEYLPNTAETGLRGSRVQTGTYYDTEPQSVTIAGNMLTSYVDSLVPGFKYRFRIRSQNAAGWGMWSGSVVATCEPFPVTLANTKTIHRIRVPRNGYYKLTAKGAKGADGRVHYGGRGAIISGTFALKAGDVLIILVGCQSSMSVCNTGGGGGTFVALNEINQEGLLIAAGGGGGTRGLEDRDEDGSDANLETWGTDGRGEEHGKGGANGGPGEDANSEVYMGPCWGYGGAGFMQDSSSARSFLGGGAGGQYGGFGGGGAVGLYGGGGGGGYSGGGGGRGGGGGGSYVKDTAIDVVKRVGHDGHGSLEIEIVPPPTQDTIHEEPYTLPAHMPDPVRGENGLTRSPPESQLQPQPQPRHPQPSIPAASAPHQAYLAQMSQASQGSQASSVSTPSVASSTQASLADSPFNHQRPLETSGASSTQHPVMEQVQQRIYHAGLESAPQMPDSSEDTLRPEALYSSRDGSTDDKVPDVKTHPTSNAADPKLLD